MMKKITKLFERVKGLSNAFVRFPITGVFLLATAVMVALSINTDSDYSKLIMTGVFGFFITATLQVAYERFFDRNKQFLRLITMGSGILLTLGYYWIIRMAPDFSMEIQIRTSVAILGIFFAFMWIPTIRNRISFNESFMVVFKSFFHAILYAAVIFAGCSLIIGALQLLIYPISEKAYSHMANIVFVLFTPMFILSLVPVYPGKKEKETAVQGEFVQEEKIIKAVSCPKFLEVLISYIIIPITEVFTVILVIYIVRNIRGEFWSNNLLEPMLVSYAISVIVVFILSSRLENKAVTFYRKVFPKVLVPIVLFQIASSILKLRETGVTHNRYFVILFGIYAVCAGILMSLFSTKKNGVLASMLIGFCVVSIIPPIDAFTVSRTSQTKVLEDVLSTNKMLEDNKIIPKDTISDGDKQKITSAVEYLSQMNYVNNIKWIPKDFKIYEDFKDTFGFDQYHKTVNDDRSVYVFLKSDKAVEIAGYESFTRTYINVVEEAETKIGEIDYNGKVYTLNKEKDGENYIINLQDENKKNLIQFNTSEIFDRYLNYPVSKSEMSVEDATFTTSSDTVKLKIVVQEANVYENFDKTEYYADIYVMVHLKNE